jgi:hypothetical protein
MKIIFKALIAIILFGLFSSSFAGLPELLTCRCPTIAEVNAVVEERGDFITLPCGQSMRLHRFSGSLIAINWLGVDIFAGYVTCQYSTAFANSGEIVSTGTGNIPRGEAWNGTRCGSIPGTVEPATIEECTFKKR